MKRYLIIQTSFIGDVVLALPVAQQLRALEPEAEIHFLVRKGNESLLANHPAINRVWVWDKQKRKYRNLWRLACELRRLRFTLVVNLQRFAAMGALTAALRADEKVGFDKNPLSSLYTRKIPHRIEQPKK